MKTAIFLVSFLLAITSLNAQRVAPGVPPQQYQPQQQQYHQQPPPPEYQQQQYQQQQYQQHPQGQVQYQQQPQGQFQQQQQPPHPQAGYQQPPQQQQQQHVPQQAGHGHGHPQQHGQQRILNPVNMQHEREHIAEHMDVPIDTSKMTEQELQFHYFKMHDSDNNNKLDGCELIKSLIHWHDTNDDKEEGEAQPRSDETLKKLVDPIMDIMDKNRDGFISWPEYRSADVIID